MMDVLSSLALADVARIARRTALAALIVGIAEVPAMGSAGVAGGGGAEVSGVGEEVLGVGAEVPETGASEALWLS